MFLVRIFPVFPYFSRSKVAAKLLRKDRAFLRNLRLLVSPLAAAVSTKDAFFRRNFIAISDRLALYTYISLWYRVISAAIRLRLLAEFSFGPGLCADFIEIRSRSSATVYL